MGADVNQRTAALLILVQEHAPRRHGTPPDGSRLGIVDVAEGTGEALVLHVLRVGTLAALVADGQQLAGLAGGVQHLLCLGGIDCHGLLAHDVLARVQGVHGDEAVGAVGRADVHHVDGFVLQQLAVVGIHRRVGRAVVLLCFAGALLNDVAERDHLHTRYLPERRHMLAVSNSAASDNADPHGLFVSHRKNSLLIKIKFSMSGVPRAAPVAREWSASFYRIRRHFSMVFPAFFRQSAFSALCPKQNREFLAHCPLPPCLPAAACDRRTRRLQNAQKILAIVHKIRLYFLPGMWYTD